MSNLRQAAQQALEAWQTATYGHLSHHKAMLLAMTALGAALAAAVAEPVLTVDALRVEFERSYKGKAGIGLARLTGGEYLSPAIETAWVQFFSKYTSPPQRELLTDEQIDDLSREMVKGGKSVNWLCRAIERAHGIAPASAPKEQP